MKQRRVVEIEKQVFPVRFGGVQGLPVELRGFGSERALGRRRGNGSRSQACVEILGKTVDRVSFRHCVKLARNALGVNLLEEIDCMPR